MFGGLNNKNKLWSGLACKLAVFNLCFDIVTVHKRNEIKTDFLWARFVAFTVIGARTEERFHCFDHALGSFEPLRLALRNEIEMREFGRSEQLRC